MTARILVLDIETQRSIVETFDLWPKYININQVRVPTRILCFAAKWHDEEEVQFYSAWDEDKNYNVRPKQYLAMIRAAWDLLNEADFVVTWNGNRFDNQWFQAEFGRLGLGPPAPFRSLDLFQVAKRKFGQGLMSLKLDWSARQWLGDRKVDHSGVDLWSDIRYGSRAEKEFAQGLMMSYNIHDVVLTDGLFERFLPWTGANFALYDEDNVDRLVCPLCESVRVQRRGWAPTLTYMYQRYFCKDCLGWSRGRKMVYTTELRPV
jgi:RNase_H superfamily